MPFDKLDLIDNELLDANGEEYNEFEKWIDRFERFFNFDFKWNDGRWL